MRKVKDFTLMSARSSKRGRKVFGGENLQSLQRTMDMRGEEKPSSQAEMADDLFLSRSVKSNYFRVIIRKYL